VSTQADEHWRFGDTTFMVDHERRDKVFDPDRLLVIKPMSMLERYVALGTQVRVHAMVELGIYQGGSTAFFYEAFKPERLVAFELGPGAPALEKFIAERELGDVVRPHFGTDQADVPTLLAHTRNDLDGRPLDLVVDDASHWLIPTRASFEALFPLVRPGGVYVIEDWNWAHYESEWWADPVAADHFRGRGHLTTLVEELVALTGSRVGAIEELRIIDQSAEIVRGDAELEAPFDLRASAVWNYLE
jgi:hypothetical protein